MTYDLSLEFFSLEFFSLEFFSFDDPAVVEEAVVEEAVVEELEPPKVQLARLQIEKKTPELWRTIRNVWNLLWKITPVICYTPMLTRWTIKRYWNSPTTLEKFTAIFRVRKVDRWHGIVWWAVSWASNATSTTVHRILLYSNSSLNRTLQAILTYSGQSQKLDATLQCWPSGHSCGIARPFTQVKKFRQFDGSFKWSGGFGVAFGGHLESTTPGPVVCEFAKAKNKNRTKTFIIFYKFDRSKKLDWDWRNEEQSL